ncbi:MAG: sigma-70 family RNA polymerase sigma factor [Acidobacteriaceae bacterium]
MSMDSTGTRVRPELVAATELMRTENPERIESALRLLQNTVYSFSMKVCGHREDAEDTMQYVLHQSLPYLAKIDNPQALSVWLYKVARNRCSVMRRKSKFAPEHTLALDELMPNERDLAHLMQNPDHGPEAAVLRGERDEQLREAVLRMPPKYRLILVLHDMEDLDTAEVARITGLKEGTVRIRLHRARLFVRKELSQPVARTKGSRRDASVSTAARGTEAPVAAGLAEAVPRSKECQEIFANLSEYLDRRTDDVTCAQLQQHIEDCEPCVAFIRDLKQTIQRCREFAVPCAPQTDTALRQLLTQEYLRLLKKTAPDAC